jgi:hypothetical protein
MDLIQKNGKAEGRNTNQASSIPTAIATENARMKEKTTGLWSGRLRLCARTSFQKLGAIVART